ncbi:MAG: PD40 domain-containing protein [Flavobacteriales bacterium]|nr:PD40 domain-containing protein [Flavobacteriales bacterium]
MRKAYIILILLTAFVANSFAQTNDDSFRNRFEEASVLMDDHWYALALPMWLKLHKQDPDNYNVNYKIGICYYNEPTEEIKGLPYLRKAAKGISKNYDPFMFSETKAKPDALYYLAHLYHIEYELDSAINYFNKFIETVSKKHILADNAHRQIEQCNNAKEQIKHPVDVKIVNLGITINSPYSEHSPVLSLDETEIVFTSRRLRKDSSNIRYKDMHDGHYYEDIYIAYKDEHGQWGEPQLINIDRVNHHLATIGLSPDNQSLYVYHDEEGNGNIYQSTLIAEEKWSRPEPVSSEINSNDDEEHMSISVDGNSLYFTSNRKGGMGGSDIYVCKKLPNGEWSKAQNIGAPINTPYDDESPFFHPDGVTLHFSSEGHNSMGGFDIFESTLQTDGTWSEPKNVGYPINSTHNDIYFVTSPDGKRGYYSSYGGGDSYGDQDIYMVLKDDAIEKELTLLKGIITVAQGDTLPGNIIINVTDNETGQLIAKSKPSMRNGSFVFIIPPGKNYNISYEINGKDFYNENIYVPMGSQYQEIEKEILLDPIAFTVSAVNDAGEKWTIKFKSLGSDVPSNLTLKCVDDNGNILFTAVRKEDGTFAFSDLPKDENYLFMLYDENGKMIDCSGIEIALFNNAKQTAILLPNKKCHFLAKDEDKVGKIAFVNLDEIPSSLKIQYMGEDGTIYFTEEVNKEGYFKYNELPSNKKIKLVLISDEPCSDAQLKIVHVGNEATVFIEFSATKDNGCIFVPLVEDKIAFQEFFTYNKNVPQRDKELQTFISELVGQVETSGKARISLESSASRVPTRTYGSNDKLSKLRADKAKKMLLDKLSKKGISEDKIVFVNVTTLVQGPKYKGDYIKNKSTYEKYQYIKIYFE